MGGVASSFFFLASRFPWLEFFLFFISILAILFYSYACHAHRLSFHITYLSMAPTHHCISTGHRSARAVYVSEIDLFILSCVLRNGGNNNNNNGSCRKKTVIILSSFIKWKGGLSIGFCMNNERLSVYQLYFKNKLYRLSTRCSNRQSFFPNWSWYTCKEPFIV